MENDVYENLSKRYSPQFGKIAVDMGFITEKQLKEAMVEEAEDSLSNRPHRFIRRILFEHGWITKKQIDIALDILSKAPV